MFKINIPAASSGVLKSFGQSIRPKGRGIIARKIKIMMKAFIQKTHYHQWIKWGKYIIIETMSFLFLIFGVDTLIGSYSLKNPMEFIMYFFSSSMIILISFVGIIYPIFQLHASLKVHKRQ